jgi:hypothetical protein
MPHPKALTLEGALADYPLSVYFSEREAVE